MKASARHAKIVEWSEEDQCYVGSAPGLIYGGCHFDHRRQHAAGQTIEQALGIA